MILITTHVDMRQKRTHTTTHDGNKNKSNYELCFHPIFPSSNTNKACTTNHTTMPPCDTLQLLFLTKTYKNTKDYVDAVPLYKIPKYITKKRNKNHTHHDEYLRTCITNSVWKQWPPVAVRVELQAH